MLEEKIPYKDFRTGLTFRDVRRMLSDENYRNYLEGVYRFITRHTVLGRWHQIKEKMYKEYIEYINNRFEKNRSLDRG